MTCAPFSVAAERNKEAILARLQCLLRDTSSVLEIGSGTGQHAVHFSNRMPWLEWTCSELPTRCAVLEEVLRAARRPNVRGPLALDVQGDWPAESHDAVFTANTFHIMPWPAVQALFARMGRTLSAAGRLVVYGPFHYGGKASSPSNAEFDRSLRASNPEMGVRNVEDVMTEAGRVELHLLGDFAMPANNRLLAWEKRDRDT